MQSRKAATDYYSKLQAQSPDTIAWNNSGKMQATWGDSVLENQPLAVTRVIVPNSFESLGGKLIKWMGIVVITPFIFFVGLVLIIL